MYVWHAIVRITQPTSHHTGRITHIAAQVWKSNFCKQLTNLLSLMSCSGKKLQRCTFPWFFRMYDYVSGIKCETNAEMWSNWNGWEPLKFWWLLGEGQAVQNWVQFILIRCWCLDRMHLYWQVPSPLYSIRIWNFLCLYRIPIYVLRNITEDSNPSSSHLSYHKARPSHRSRLEKGPLIFYCLHQAPVISEKKKLAG